ncbi:MAG: lipopolysaccharide transport periplasmic protein LptA [Gammaproteobacteria bacterium]|nr:lipopolysaccharide transport periplasmic protein LptA [Gammaproteobacteria bacterium]
MNLNQRRLLPLILSLFPFLCFGAEEEDSPPPPLPISIESDSVTLDKQHGISRYLGGVLLEQGEISFRSDELLIEQREGEVTEVVASGSPVTFERKSAPRLYAKAQKLHYAATEGVITLTGDALLQQGGDRFEGEKIRYYIQNNRIEASSGTPSQSQERSRVRVTLQPRPEKGSGVP